MTLRIDETVLPKNRSVQDDASLRCGPAGIFLKDYHATRVFKST